MRTKNGISVHFGELMKKVKIIVTSEVSKETIESIIVAETNFIQIPLNYKKADSISVEVLSNNQFIYKKCL